jgi:multiple sugar transport system substrate-binding protein
METEKGITRRGVLRLGALALPVVGAACGGPASSGAGSQPPAASAPQGSLVIMSRADQSILELFKAQVAAFQQEHPGIQIEIDHQDQAAWLEKFKTMAAAGTPLDSCFANDSNAVPFARDGLTEDLEPYLAKTKDFREADFAEGAWFAMKYKSKRYGLPWDSGAYALFYNMDLLDASGVPYPDPKKRMNWDELLTVSRRLTIDANGRRAGEGGFDPNNVKQVGLATNFTWGLAHFVHSNGGEMLSADGKVLMDQPPAIEALQFMADMGAKHFVRQAPQYTPNPNPIGFRTNNLAIDHNGAWQIGRYATDVKRVGVAPAPYKKNQTSSGHYSPLVMTKHSKNKDAAWAWMAFATLSEKGLTILSDAGQIQPPRKSLIPRFVDPPGNKVEGKYRQVFVDELANKEFRVTGDKQGTYWGGVPGWAPTLATLLTPVLRGEKSAASVAGDIKQYVEQLLTTLQPPVLQ